MYIMAVSQWRPGISGAAIARSASLRLQFAAVHKVARATFGRCSLAKRFEFIDDRDGDDYLPHQLRDARATPTIATRMGMGRTGDL